MSEQVKADMADLLGRPQFRRFLFRMIERGGLFTSATSGADNRDLSFAEGRRSLLLEMLADVESGQPQQHASGWPLTASIQTLCEEVQTPQRDLEKPRGRRSRNDQYRDLDGDGSGE